jgi:DNA polymerase-1
VSEPRDVAAALKRAASGAVIGCWPVSSASGEPVGAILALAGGEPGVALIRVDAQLLGAEAGRHLSAWMADPAVHKIGHDLKAAHRLLARFGVALRGVAGDTMVAAYLLNPARTSQPLSDVADEHLERSLPPVPEFADDLAGGAAAGAQACADAAAAVSDLHEKLTGQLASRGLLALYRDMELPLIEVLARMEDRGVAVDVPYLQGLSAQMAATLGQLCGEIERLAGGPFNVNSPKQLAQVLFDKLKLPVIKRTKTGPSTDADVLRQLAEKHPLPAQLIRYRELSKLVSTYVDALPRIADASGRVHTSFNQAATATGRLSSSEPNLQNIPIRTELGRSIRRAFVSGARDGALVAADYSQIELRILAHLSGDEQLTEAFRQERDIHRYTASLIYGVPEAEVQPEQRSAMKAVNFGILYGMSAHGLSKELGMDFAEAQSFIDAYFARYPKVRAYLDSQIAQARRDGFVQTLLGRRRYIPEVNSPDPMLRQVGERMAINAPVQGTAADIIKLAMVRLDHELERAGLESRMVLQVHDELVFDGPRREVPALAALVRRVMEAAVALSVPLTVTVKAGPNWLDVTPVT